MNEDKTELVPGQPENVPNPKVQVFLDAQRIVVEHPDKFAVPTSTLNTDADRLTASTSFQTPNRGNFTMEVKREIDSNSQTDQLKIASVDRKQIYRLVVKFGEAVEEDYRKHLELADQSTDPIFKSQLQHIARTSFVHTLGGVAFPADILEETNIKAEEAAEILKGATSFALPEVAGDYITLAELLKRTPDSKPLQGSKVLNSSSQ